MRVPFALPDIGEEEVAEVVRVLRSGWITTGKEAKRFEEEFARYLGGGLECIAVNSATAGLHLALEAVGIGPGDEVIVPTHTFTATAEVVRYLGADPVFVDIETRSYCLDPAAVQRALSPKTKAILPVHYAGHPANMRAILELARDSGLHVVEDAAHALPTLYEGALVGTLASSATVFSFYATKTMTTGEGGMIVTRHGDLAKRARIMRLHGIDRDAFDRYTSTRPAWYYEVVAPGYKYNLTDLAAAIGVQQLGKAGRFFETRARMASRYDAAFADLPLTLPPRPASGQHAWHLYVIALAEDAPIQRDELIAKLYERGIGCSVHYIPLHMHPYWRDRYSLRPEAFPHSHALFERGVSLPIHTKMTDADQSFVIDTVRELLT
jgi:dTDP-4-amino-4,6-dideoxygalactose transaminase